MTNNPHSPASKRRLMHLLNCKDRSGAVAIEFAFVAPLLILLFVASVEIGFAARSYLLATQAASAGASVAAHDGWNLDSISAAVIDSSSNETIKASPTAVTFCGCTVGNSINRAVCGVVCGDSLVTRRYATIYASVSRRTSISGTTALPDTITASATVQLP